MLELYAPPTRDNSWSKLALWFPPDTRNGIPFVVTR